MFKISKVAQNRVDLILTGKVTSVQMAIALDDLFEIAQSIENGKMLYTIEGLQMPELGAIAVELTRLPKLFGLISKFTHCAVIADTSWIRTLSEIEGALIPGFEIKSFEPGQETAAEEWLSKK